MKLQASDRSVEIQGSNATVAFSIEASAKAFAILSDGLYSNKIKAVIRELSTNAADAHVDAGNEDTPFDVQFPTSQIPIFSVRDYGIGLSHEDCMVLFTTYFRSTKNNSNDAVGCLGLGSKSPFAYADNFVVDSYFNGVKRSYAAYKNDDGPHFDFMEEVPTDEPNGLHIQVPVDKYDIRDFEIAGQQVYRFFDKRPTLHNFNRCLDYSKSVDGKNWAVYSDLQDNYIVMGQVAYPLDGERFQDKEIRAFLDSVSGLVLTVPIGTADITPSRESLSYNTMTVDSLTRALDTIPSEVGDSVSKVLASEKTLFSARMTYLNMEGFTRSLAGDVSWNGVKLFDDMRHNTITIDPNQLSLWGNVYKFFQHRGRRGVTKEVAPRSIKFSKSKTFIFKDCDGAYTGRIKKYIADNYWQDSMAIVFYDGELKDFLKLLGDAEKTDIIMLSDLPKPPKNSKLNVGGSTPCYIYDEDEGGFVESNMSVKFQDAYYLEESYGKVNLNGRAVPLYQVGDMIKIMIDAGAEFDGTFYCTKPSVVRNSGLASRPNWSNGKTVLHDMFKSIVEDFKDELAMAKDGADWTDYYRTKEIFDDGFLPNHPIQALIAEYQVHKAKVQAAKKNIESWHKISDIFNVDYTPLNTYSRDYFTQEYKKLTGKYPALTGFTYRKAEARQYIQDMDELHNLREFVANLKKAQQIS